MAGGLTVITLVVIRRITPEGAFLHDVELLHQGEDWNSRWSLLQLMEAAHHEVGFPYTSPHEALEYDSNLDDDPCLVITNIHLLKLSEEDAELYGAIMNIVEEGELGGLSFWLQKLSQLADAKEHCEFEGMLDVILKQVILLGIPLVIPPGQCENDFRPK